LAAVVAGKASATIGPYFASKSATSQFSISLPIEKDGGGV
jgi:short-subunit dehydrogenase